MDAFSCGIDVSNFEVISCGNTSVKHLLYADDILVFGKASISNADMLNEALSIFADHSGLKIDKLCSKFLFHGSVAAKKLHLVSWKKTSTPKCCGGLGLPSINSLQFAHGVSFLWRYYNFDTIVGDWLRAKYSSPYKPLLVRASKFWKFISSTASKVKGDLAFHVSSINCNLSMLWDPWCAGFAVSELSQGHLLNNYTVKEFISDGRWSFSNWSAFPLLNRITYVPILNGPIHAVTWIGSSNPVFKTFYMKFYSDLETVHWYKFVWHKNTALRHSAYVWLTLLDGLKTADILAKRNIVINPVCPLCRKEAESIVHCFFQCAHTFAVISSLIPLFRNFLLPPTLLQLFDFIDGNRRLHNFEKEFCYFVICCTVYYLWRDRNTLRFTASKNTVQDSIRRIIHAIKVKTFNWKRIELLKVAFPSCF
ncbi:uncharacterized protein LOC114578901 [Dendrobium catenatum]|uniref:uncharacterized protein LOC114578901 n=1 Tax=Dendrobium catenatum TaxID=906689 RepID=UPI00109FC02F|nr:uncharacterized protein LOC114578901 [Dendrobium catenatum]